MAQYMLLFYETPAELARGRNPATADAYWGAWMAYVGAVKASGLMVEGNGLEPPQTAVTVRMQGGQRQVQDGPYADTRDHLGGYFILECQNLEQALDWAARAPSAADGGTEVRPVMIGPDAPAA